jgi:tRNA wybutosine-synthesizing protein 3
MGFDADKKNTLGKLDKSKKGSLDEDIADLVNFINSLDNFYTTSSCAGRIMLLKEGKAGKKYETTWLFSSHDKISVSSLSHISEFPKEKIWFRMEPPIIHICPRDLIHAKELLNTANAAGFRRAGAITLNRRIIVELVAPGTLDVLYANNGKILLADEYLEVIIEEANRKLEEARIRLERFYKEMRKRYG